MEWVPAEAQLEETCLFQILRGCLLRVCFLRKKLEPSHDLTGTLSCRSRSPSEIQQSEFEAEALMRRRGAPVAQTNGDSSDDDADRGEGQGPAGHGRSGEAWANPGSGPRRSNGGRGSDDPEASLAWVSRQAGAGTLANGCEVLGLSVRMKRKAPDVYRAGRLSFAPPRPRLHPLHSMA